MDRTVFGWLYSRQFCLGLQLSVSVRLQWFGRVCSMWYWHARSGRMNARNSNGIMLLRTLLRLPLRSWTLTPRMMDFRYGGDPSETTRHAVNQWLLGQDNSTCEFHVQKLRISSKRAVSIASTCCQKLRTTCLTLTGALFGWGTRLVLDSATDATTASSGSMVVRFQRWPCWFDCQWRRGRRVLGLLTEFDSGWGATVALNKATGP